MGDVLMTGFPGFLGSALLPRILERREDAAAYCLIQSHYQQLAGERVAQIEAAHPHTVGRISLVAGDITAPGLGIDFVERTTLDGVTEVWHLAAVYDLAVPEAVAHRVNVEGTAHVIEFCQSRESFDRLQYVSTCYVSGDYDGEFPEDELDLGQGFLNHYESTKFEAEVLVRRAMKADLPATIYRPGIVVGDSQTGETQKYDGPYFYATYIQRLPRVAIIPGVGDFDVVRAGLVPRDYVIDAIDTISAKLTVAKYAQDHDIRLVSSMGGANKLHPECLRFADIFDTVRDPMSRIMRKECKKRGIKSLHVLFSCEESVKTQPRDPSNIHERTELGTASFMPPIMGQMIAGEVIRQISGRGTERVRADGQRLD